MDPSFYVVHGTIEDSGICIDNPEGEKGVRSRLYSVRESKKEAEQIARWYEEEGVKVQVDAMFMFPANTPPLYFSQHGKSFSTS